MQLSKLRKSQTLLKKFQKLKYLSLGSIMPSPQIPSPEKLAQKMIDNDSCLHAKNNSQVLLTQFSNQVPRDARDRGGRYDGRDNRLYAFFVKQVNFLVQQFNAGNNAGSGSGHLHLHNTANNNHNNHNNNAHSPTTNTNTNTNNNININANTNASNNTDSNNQLINKQKLLKINQNNNTLSQQIKLSRLMQREGRISGIKFIRQNHLKQIAAAVSSSNNNSNTNSHTNSNTNIHNNDSTNIRQSTTSTTKQNDPHSQQKQRRSSIKLKHNKQKSKNQIIEQTLTNIYQQVDKKHQIKKYRIEKLQKQMEKLYVDSHQLYVEFMDVKKFLDGKNLERVNAHRQYQRKLEQQMEQKKKKKMKKKDMNKQRNFGHLREVEEFLGQDGTPAKEQQLAISNLIQSQVQIQLQQQSIESPTHPQNQTIQPSLSSNQPLKIPKHPSSHSHHIHKNTLHPPYLPKTAQQIQKQAQLDNLSKQITDLKQIIQKKQQTCTKLKTEQTTLQEEKITFLKLLLKNGYHTSVGIQWILYKLACNKGSLGKGDLFGLLDQISKGWIIKDYQAMKHQMYYKNKNKNNPLNVSNNTNNTNNSKNKNNSSKKNLLPKISQTQPQLHSHSHSQPHSHNPSHLSHYNRLLQIPPNQDSMSIYRQTKNYLIDWVRQQKWKTRSLKHHTSQQKITERQQWRNQEYKRLKKTYSKETFQKIAHYMFGNTKYFNKFNIRKQVQKSVRNDKRKDSLTSNTSISDQIIKKEREKNIDNLKFKILTRTKTDK